MPIARLLSIPLLVIACLSLNSCLAAFIPHATYMPLLVSVDPTKAGDVHRGIEVIDAFAQKYGYVRQPADPDLPNWLRWYELPKTLTSAENHRLPWYLIYEKSTRDDSYFFSVSTRHDDYTQDPPVNELIGSITRVFGKKRVTFVAPTHGIDWQFECMGD